MATVYEYITATGVIVADTSQILADVQAEYKAVFGADLVTDPSTPQGVLITAEALARSNVVQNNAALANQINPNVAGGVFLDAIMALTGMQRTAQTQTSVINVSVTGVEGTIIPAGSRAQTAALDIFTTDSQVILGADGTAKVDFTALNYGPIPCAANALNQIVSGVLGWETVNNDPDSTPGSLTTLGTTTQSDQAARALRNNTLAFQGVALPEAITSALYATAGVRSLTFQENIAATQQVINGITMVPHSIYACIEGGTDLAVAEALLENKSSGSAWNGTTTQDVIEPASGQTYPVKFDRPEQIGILVKVTTPNGNEADVVASVLDYAAGLVSIINQNGVQQLLAGFVVGADVSPFEIAAAIAAENPGIYVQKVEVSLVSPISYSTDQIAIGVNEIAQTQAGYVTVVVP